MTFDEIIEKKLWAVRYADKPDNELDRVLDEWGDVESLFDFFSEHFDDLAYFKVSTIEEAVKDTLEDRDRLEKVILDCEKNLEDIFQPLDNRVALPKYIEQMKAKGEKKRHDSWLRIYAIRLNDGKYIITGGTIKLTKEMHEREHTREELVKLNKVKDFLIENDVFDDDSFIDYIETK